jgi:NADPH-dependent curcumin reductase CurA
MGSGAVAEVINSGSSETLPPGTLVVAKTDWTEYSVLDVKDCQVIQPLPGLRVTHFLGSFGLPGLTAYYALAEIVKVTKNDTIVVSGAAGATGSMAIQIAKKLIGCKRVGFLTTCLKNFSRNY